MGSVGGADTDSVTRIYGRGQSVLLAVVSSGRVYVRGRCHQPQPKSDDDAAARAATN